MTNNAALIGFTLINGATRTNGDFQHDECGGGIWCEPSSSAAVSNCRLVGNIAQWDGGGAAYGNYSNCTFVTNAAGPTGYGGGAYNCTLNNCLLAGNSANYGGGANSGALNSCTVTNNSAWAAGGGVAAAGVACTRTTAFWRAIRPFLPRCRALFYPEQIVSSRATRLRETAAELITARLNNCLVTSNSAPSGFGYGGGAYQATMNNCTLLGNWAGQLGGGSYYGMLNNCLLTGNYVVSGTGGGCYYGT